MIEKWYPPSDKMLAQMEASSELVQIVNATTLDALLKRTNELLSLPAETTFESLGFRRKPRRISHLQLTEKHLLAICIRILEKDREGTPMTNEDVGKFIGFSVIGSYAQPIINALPVAVAHHIVKAGRTYSAVFTTSNKPDKDKESK